VSAEYTIIYDGPTMTINKVMSQHWRKRARYIKPVRAIGKLLALEARLPCPFPAPVNVRIRHFYKGPRPDTVAISPTVKALIDGLTDYGCWPDDSPDYVAEETYAAPVHDLKYPRIEITLTNNEK